MNKSSILSITMTLTGWPAAAVCGLGVIVAGGVLAFLGSKLIDNKYQFTTSRGTSLTSNC